MPKNGSGHLRIGKDRMSQIIKSLEEMKHAKIEPLVSNKLDIASECQQDSLTALFTRAQSLTALKKNEIQRARAIIQVSQKEKASTFLTGLGIHSLEKQPIKAVEQEEINENQLLVNLRQDCNPDDLAELRRMIKETDRNLSQYRDQLLGTKRELSSFVTKSKSIAHFRSPRFDIQPPNHMEIKKFAGSSIGIM